MLVNIDERNTSYICVTSYSSEHHHDHPITIILYCIILHLLNASGNLPSFHFPRHKTASKSSASPWGYYEKLRESITVEVLSGYAFICLVDYHIFKNIISSTTGSKNP